MASWPIHNGISGSYIGLLKIGWFNKLVQLHFKNELEQHAIFQLQVISVLQDCHTHILHLTHSYTFRLLHLLIMTQESRTLKVILLLLSKSI